MSTLITMRCLLKPGEEGPKGCLRQGKSDPRHLRVCLECWLFCINFKEE